MIELYTDGACSGNPGPGGWAAIIVEDGAKRSLQGGQEQTTNNRMEILAVIKGLESLPASAEATVLSDSQYVVNTMTRNWKRSANRDLWERLDTQVAKRKVSWQWVRGHASNPHNEEADALAVRESRLAAEGQSRAGLTHVDDSGKARMVNVGSKPATHRVAVAKGAVITQPETLDLIRSNALEKGDVLVVARVAGIMGAKNTQQVIPLCHPLPLDHVSVDFELDESRSAVGITATASTTSKTGVEMEAMTAVAIAALTIYDMCKAVDRGIRIDSIRLVSKRGGKSGDLILEE